MKGRIISDKYVIDEKIGSGGTADVYKAYSVSDPNLVFAIKFLKEEYQNNGEYVRRFVREAQAGMQLIHPNIVKVIDTGVDNEVNYIVFEYISGHTLKDYMSRKGVFSEKAAANIVGNILDAIGYAHSKGIIHRDVKPQNVMLTSDGAIKLADFGIARVTTASTKSFSGTKVMGSVHYISPEQAAGKDIQYQSDLYSVGIILYEMLTGTLPYDNQNEVSVALMHINGKMEHPIKRNPKISHALNAVILKATAKDINIRYKSAEEFKNDLFLALKMPDGTFADLDDEELDPEHQGEMVGKLNKGIFNTLVILCSVIAVMIVAFIIVQATYKPYVSVQSVIGKTVDEANTLMANNLSISVVYESSDNSPGYIIRQDPEAGSRVQKGSKLVITVSVGSERAVTPNAQGLTLYKAFELLEKKGLGIGQVVYEENSEVEDGLVFKQEPAADDEVDINSLVTLYISGSPLRTGTLPDVSNIKLGDAVKKINDAGFMHIRVRLVADSDTKKGYVISQRLPSGLNIDAENTVELSVSGTHGNSACDCAFNITVEGQEEPIVITIVSKEGYELVAYEKLASPGVHTASFTAYMDEDGEYECIVYKSEKEYKRSKYNFKSGN